MDAKSDQVNQETIPSTFNLGQTVLADFEGNKKFSPSVICQDFGTDEKYTIVKNLEKKGLTRFYYVQHLGHGAWLPSSQVKAFKKYKTDLVSKSCPDENAKKLFLEHRQKIIGKSNEEIRPETYESLKNLKNPAEIVEDVDAESDLKTENIELKFQLKSLKESWDNLEQLVDSENQPKTLNESKNENQDPENDEKPLVAKLQAENDNLKNELKILKESHNEIKKSFIDLKNIMMSKNHNKPQIEQETNSNNAIIENQNQNSAKIIDAEEPDFEYEYEFEWPVKKIWLKDESEVQKLNQVITDLKKDNLYLSQENAILLDTIDGYEEMQQQNEAMVKNLKEDNLKLYQEILDLKYVHLGSKSDLF